jgi:beta-lactamase class C
MNRRHFVEATLAGGVASALFAGPRWSAAAADAALGVTKTIDDFIRPLIAEHGLPGMAVGVTLAGQRHFAGFGLADTKRSTPVVRETLFELGSISKTFTATLAALAAIEGKLQLSDTVARHMPELADVPIGRVRLRDLATHTAGGFPLQLPAGTETEAQIMAYFRSWKPRYAPGARRTYANPSVGLLGLAVARAMGGDFRALVETRLFPALGLTRTYLRVPEKEMPAYAWGIDDRSGKQVRASEGPIAGPAWGVRSNIDDLLQYLEVQIGIARVAADVARAVAETHTGYYRVGPFIQDLIWEQYPTPAALADMELGNSPALSQRPNAAVAIEPPMPPRADVVLNKTGSTAGFGAYVLCRPESQFGITLLANKFYPNAARIRAAYAIMERLIG